MEVKDQILTQISQYLDISPSNFKIAQERFNAVKGWLVDGTYESGSAPDVYLQGSFRLGTVVRPYQGDKDGDFDIDQVCELSIPNQNRSPNVLKNDVGNRLKENIDYRRMLDDEGKRCWTLGYASDEGRPGFHIDILPSLPTKNGDRFQIDITDKENAIYSWSISNPKGYYSWFRSKNLYSQEFIDLQSREIYEANRDIYSSLDDVPKQLFRSPLQRAIQIMKRHRDVHFSVLEYKPISVIITTIVTHLYSENGVGETIFDFLRYVLERHESLIKNGFLISDGVLDFNEKKWSIPNPVDLGKSESDVENFADKWNSDPALPTAFFDWAKQLKRDLIGFSKSGVSDDLNLRTKSFSGGTPYAEILKREIREGLDNSNNLLQLIHLGIEKKMEWKSIKDIAQSVYDDAKNENSKNIAKVNYYQIAIHRGLSLSEDAIKDVRQILSNNQTSTAFVMCCNLILGTATREMISRCISDVNYENVLEWPILRLAERRHLLPMEYA